MKRFVGFLLAVSVPLYITPLRADSYESNQDIYAEDSSVDSNGGCEVTPEAATPSPSSEEQNSYVQQNAEDQNAAEEENTYSDKGNYTDGETLVTPENPSQNRSHPGRWKNILLAVAVVAVAITAMLLVHSHQGHKHKSDH
jgi:hypothetical protein